MFQFSEAAERTKQLQGDVNGTSAAAAGPEDNGQEVCVGHLLMAVLKKPFPRPLVLGPVLDAEVGQRGIPLRTSPSRLMPVRIVSSSTLE